MKIFLTIDSEQLKSFLNSVKNLKVVQFKFVTKSELIKFSAETCDIRLEVLNVQSVERYTLAVSLNDQRMGKFRVLGIQNMKTSEEKREVELKTPRGVIFITFMRKSKMSEEPLSLNSLQHCEIMKRGGEDE